VGVNTKQKKWYIPCCKDKKCRKCKGKGRVHPKRCPSHYYQGELRTLRYLYDSYQYKNLLPFSGSPLDQPKVLFDYFGLINYYVGLIDELKKTDTEDNAAFSAKINRVANG